MTDQETDILALYGVPGVGTKTFARLIERYGDAGAVFSASRKSLLEMDGIGDKIAGNILSHDRKAYIEEQQKRMTSCGAEMIVRGDRDYPRLLDRFHSAPPLLFIRGDRKVLNKTSIAFVGTRKPTPYGVKMARKLASETAVEGICVVSGMAAGIDSACHHSALESGGETIAVFGCGVDIIYPSTNRKLSGDIVKSGCLLSHFPMGTPATTGSFPARNSVVVGLSLATVVVEAPEGSGALITANLALKAQRPLFVVPANADSEKSAGSNQLFARGAHPLTAMKNVFGILRLEHSGVSSAPAKKKERELPPGLGGEIIRALEKKSLQIEEMAHVLGKPVSELLMELTPLELEGHVRQKPGKIFEINY